MPVNLISEEELRVALSPYRAHAEQFEAAVSERVKEGTGEEIYSLTGMHPMLRTAASILPPEVLTAGQASPALLQSASVGGTLSKLLAYAAFPAISLFVLLGSAIFGAAGVRKIRNASNSQAMNEEVLRTSTKRWWHDHRWGGWMLIVTTIALAFFGATWLMFAGYIVSTLILLYILKSFARIGIGNRVIVGQSCALGLALLGQAAGFVGIGDREIHLIDQALLVPVFFAGALIVYTVLNWESRILRTILQAVVTLALAAWVMHPILWPSTPARIEAYTASFDHAEFSNVSWRQWEIVASWAIRSNSALDLSRPRRLLAQEIADSQNPVLPMILGSAFHAGLVEADQIGQIKDYEMQLHTLLGQPRSSRISPLDMEDWIIRAAVLRGDLTQEQRDYMVERLHVTLQSFLSRPNPGTLQEPLLATELLEVLGRPVDPELYRIDMHALLMRFHTKTSGGFQRAGGFKVYENLPAGDLEATSDAVRLMEIYGRPRDLDVNWVRSFLRPSFLTFSPQKWIAAVTMDRLNRLPDIPRVSWFEVIYYERSFLAAFVLIGLCIYATAISPKPQAFAQRANR